MFPCYLNNVFVRIHLADMLQIFKRVLKVNIKILTVKFGILVFAVLCTSVNDGIMPLSVVYDNRHMQYIYISTIQVFYSVIKTIMHCNSNHRQY